MTTPTIHLQIVGRQASPALADPVSNAGTFPLPLLWNAQVHDTPTFDLLRLWYGIRIG
jgi:hypothetical protein